MASTYGSDTSRQSSSSRPRIASGFKSWLKTKATIKKNVEFVQEDPGGTRQRNGGFPNVFKSQNNAHIQHSPEESGLLQSPAAHRRQQVYRAQKRHRDRKADYVQSLEAEIARLRHLDTVVNSKKSVLEHQNQAMKGFLASHNLDEGSANKHVDVSSESRSDPSTVRSDATVDVRYDAEVGHERTFLDVEEDYVDSTPGREASKSPPAIPNSLDDSTESWKALDFILALEWPCRDHIHHHAINPLPTQNGVEPASVPSQNHALTATQTVYSCALEPSSSPLARKTPAWHLPHSEIEKLVTLSSQLPVNDDMMTPAQAYSTICLELPLLSSKNSSIGRIMEALKVPLSQKVSCFGFGAALPAVDFYAVFDSAMTAMSETSNTLGQ
ncbi:hypothetical protein KC363_g7486 [Hortaea werneckii]|uniref:BZIP domain-containing protein n=1 Tax=Hortaea werneckii TaxID=91943 RepID=A0A3M7F6N6_HORWE|nr:hypothetical protein KC361_g8037 [Hortaea werneckii]KAI7184848.1 hypothetical protein KC363_g7486 [Hortaea werneckii]KAI7504347.1 hypothetical protein KC347_g8372 [Hortaea werneckii]RMY84555.1 hypothetical protein D0861_06900 [Hortaea werneckii]